MSGMAQLCVGQREQDFLLLAASSRRESSIDPALFLFVCEASTPPPQSRRRRGGWARFAHRCFTRSWAMVDTLAVGAAELLQSGAIASSTIANRPSVIL